MELYLKNLIAERNMTLVSFGNIGNVEYETLKTMLKRKSCKVSTLAKYASLLKVPTWEMIYNCGISALGHELPEWSTPNTSMRIRELMDEKGVTQKMLAEKMGIVAPAVSTLLARNNPGLPNIEAIAKALDVEPYELFISRENMQREIDRRNGISATDPEPAEGHTSQPNDSVVIEDLFAAEQESPSDKVQTLTIEQSKERTRKAIRMLIESIACIDEEKIEKLINKVYE